MLAMIVLQVLNWQFCSPNFGFDVLAVVQSALCIVQGVGKLIQSTLLRLPSINLGLLQNDVYPTSCSRNYHLMRQK